jgi:hypothetical protein
MSKTGKTANDLWRVIKSKNLGDVVAPVLIQNALHRAVEDERQEIIATIGEHHWSYSKIPFTMWCRCLFLLCFRPRQFFGTYFKVIQCALVKKLESRG